MKKSAYKLSIDLLGEIKYLYRSTVVGLLGTLVINYGYPLSHETINEMKDALIDHFYDGLDPEFEDESLYYWFEGLNSDWFKIINGELKEIKHEVQATYF